MREASYKMERVATLQREPPGSVHAGGPPGRHMHEAITY
jgi:hypothetical protein